MGDLVDLPRGGADDEPKEAVDRGVFVDVVNVDERGATGILEGPEGDERPRLKEGLGRPRDELICFFAVGKFERPDRRRFPVATSYR